MGQSSVAGFCKAGGDMGIVVYSRSPAAGAVVPWAGAGVEALATRLYSTSVAGARLLRLPAEATLQNS